jgi:hypothetical protein
MLCGKYILSWNTVAVERSGSLGRFRVFRSSRLRRNYLWRPLLFRINSRGFLFKKKKETFEERVAMAARRQNLAKVSDL